MIRIDGTRFEEALGRAGDGVCVVSSDGRVLLWNDAAQRILGHRADDVVGRSCSEVFAGRDERGNRLCRLECRVSALIQLQKPVQHFDMATRARDGRTVWLGVSVIALPTAQGCASMHVFRDVTASHPQRESGSEPFATSPSGDAETVGTLTKREIEVLRLVALGHQTKAVAAKLNVRPATIRNHVQNVLMKLEVHNRLEAVAYARRHGLL